MHPRHSHEQEKRVSMQLRFDVILYCTIFICSNVTVKVHHEIIFHSDEFPGSTFIMQISSN